MKNTFLLTVLCVSLFAAPAMAAPEEMPGGDDTMPSLTPAMIERICSGQNDTSCCERLQKQINGLRAGLDEFRKERGRILGRLAALEKQPSAGREKLEAQLTALEDARKAFKGDMLIVIQSQFGNIAEQLAAMKNDNDLQEIKLVELDVNDGEQDERLDGLDKAVAEQSQRMDAIEPTRKAVDLGVSAGVLYIGSKDFDYTGVSIGGRLALRVSEEFYFYGEPSMLMADDRRPFGMMLASGIGYEPAERQNDDVRAALEIGPVLVGMAANDQLDFKSIATDGSVGVAVLLPHGFRFGLSVLAGPRFDKGDPEFSWGLATNLGYDFGSGR